MNKELNEFVNDWEKMQSYSKESITHSAAVARYIRKYGVDISKISQSKVENWIRTDKMPNFRQEARGGGIYTRRYVKVVDTKKEKRNMNYDFVLNNYKTMSNVEMALKLDTNCNEITYILRRLNLRRTEQELHCIRKKKKNKKTKKTNGK